MKNNFLYRIIALATVLIFAGISINAQNSIQPLATQNNWVPLSVTNDDDGNALVLFLVSSGSGSDQYIIASFNGSDYAEISSFSFSTGNDNPAPLCIKWDKGRIYMGGRFNDFQAIPNSQAIVVYESGQWSALGAGLPVLASYPSTPVVNDIEIFNNQLVVGGCFSLDGSTPFHPLAKWNGVAWSSFGNALLHSSCGISTTVQSLVSDGSTLYAAGSFDRSGNVFLNNIAAWNNSSWQPLGPGLPNVPVNGIFDMEVFNHEVYVSCFMGSGCQVQRWNNSGWSNLMGGFSTGSYMNLYAHGNELFIGGDFSFNNRPIYGLCSWNGYDFNGYGLENQSSVSKIFSAAGDLFCIGMLNILGNTSHTGMITSLTGLNEAIVNTVNVSVYPNPSADYIFIDFGNQNASKMSLNIYNCSGALVYNTSSYSGESINVGGFANGIYFVDINDGANSYRTTFYKN